MRKIQTALISVYHKENLDLIVQVLHSQNVRILSTGGTYDYIKSQGVEVEEVAEMTGFPSILGGRVKTLHPKVFGGILAIRNDDHLGQLAAYDIPQIDLVIVDLYPFEETVANTSDEMEIIEKIDIGGVSLIRAAAKNFRDVLVAGSQKQYPDLLNILESNGCASTMEERRMMASRAFAVTMHYDSAIYRYFEGTDFPLISGSLAYPMALRYGENPHQAAHFYGDLSQVFEKLTGKELSYNNLVDVDAAIRLIGEFDADQAVFAILKHTNPCGCAVGDNIDEAWERALAADPVSAFGGVLISSKKIEAPAAQKIGQIFFEVLLAPDFSTEAMEILQQKKNRILLKIREFELPGKMLKTTLNGLLVQDADETVHDINGFTLATTNKPTSAEEKDLLFANKLVKHLKSNAIALVRDQQFLAGGNGQTSRVDACRQAIEKAQHFGFDLKGAVMASDAFFPFSDSIELAFHAGVKAVIQPGGSIKDQLSIDFCNDHGIAMVFTGIRHFRH